MLSIAYRKAFSEGRMRDVRIRQFAEEIIGNLSMLFEHPGVELELKADVVAALMIDEAIPLGLALVECVMAALEAEGAHVVAVRLAELEAVASRDAHFDRRRLRQERAQCEATGRACSTAWRPR